MNCCVCTTVFTFKASVIIFTSISLDLKQCTASKHSWALRWAWWAKHLEFRSHPLYNIYGAHNWPTMGITLAKTMGMPYKKNLFYQCVGKEWYYTGSFMGRPMCAPLNTNEWQNSGFTLAISWANQCEAHVIPICGETVVIHGQFHGPTMWSPCNANVWQNSGLAWSVSWANQCEPKQYQSVAKRLFYMGNFRGRSARNHVIPMCGKSVSLHGQCHGSTNVNPM